MTLRGLTSQDIARRQKLPVNGDILVTGTLTASVTEEVVTIANPGTIVAYQRKGTLQYQISFSLNGEDYYDMTAKTDATIGVFNTYPVKYVKVVRTAGEGKVVIVSR